MALVRRSVMERVLGRVEGEQLAGTMRGVFARRTEPVLAQVMGKGLVQIEGQLYDAVEDIGTAGQVLPVVNVGRPGAAVYASATAVASVGSNARFVGGSSSGSGGTSGGGSSTTVGTHGLGDTAIHVGVLGDTQAPQFLKTDGSRALTGNLTVGTGITIDGVDISVHAANVNAHHDKLHAILDTAHHSYTGGAALDVFGLSAASTLAKLTPSSDVSAEASGGSLLRSASGALTVKNLTVAADLVTDRVAGHLIPKLTDTYDIGTSTLLWRKGWLSELDTILFAQNTITLLGGWFYVTPNAGVLPSAVSSGMTTIDFGKTMTVGDFVVMRSSLAVEYLQITSSGGGTLYNVTRNLDGSGANNWVAGAPYAVLGSNGKGRIELNAYSRPKIQLLRQGATYNAQTEIVRIGDLDGNWGYSAEAYGFAMGEYASGKPNVTLDLTNGLRFRSHTTNKLVIDASGSAYFAGVVRLGTSGELRQGTASSGDLDGAWAGLSGFTGLRMWRESDVGRIAGYNAGTLQWGAGSDGKLTAGGGVVRLDANGIGIDTTTAASWTRSYGFSNGSGLYGGVRGWVSGSNRIDLYSSPTGSGNPVIYVLADGTVTNPGSVVLSAWEAPDHVDITLSGSNQWVTVDAVYMEVKSPIGTTSYIDAATYVDSGAAFRRSGTEGFIFVPAVTASLTDSGSSVWNGTLSRNTGTYTFDLAAAANGSLPGVVKAVAVLVSGQWAAASSSSYLAVRPRGGSTNYIVMRAQAAGISNDASGIVAVDATYGDVEVVVAGATASNCVARVLGYFV